MATAIQWPFEAKYALVDDYTDYLSRSLVIGLELELDWKDEQSEDNKCEYCDDGRETCDYCDGEGTEDCEECDGEGTVECPSCKGSGEIKVNQYASDECYNCEGSGKITCDDCNGDGTYECGECGGSGNYECGDCGGSGYYDDGDGGYRPAMNDTIRREFGVEVDESICPICEEDDCWKHFPPNMIRDIHVDGSINGLEFLIYGNNISSEEFARRLPIDKLRKYFKPTQNDGLHSHAMLVHQALPIPETILRNGFQLFRAYYPAWVYLFGNQAGVMLRDNEYSDFHAYNVNATEEQWFRKALDRSGFNILNINNADEDYRNDGIKNGLITNFDVEIRTSDSTLDLEQLVAVRALTKALILRASQLSSLGIIKIPKDIWEKVEPIIETLNDCSPPSDTDVEYMKELTEMMIKEMSPFMSEFERICVKNIFKNPIRDRTEAQLATSKIIRELSETDKKVKGLITRGTIESSTISGWLSDASKELKIDEHDIRQSLNLLKAKFDSDLGTYTIVEIK